MIFSLMHDHKYLEIPIVIIWSVVSQEEKSLHKICHDSIASYLYSIVSMYQLLNW